jgi:sodium/potassium/calcium exchanger 6
MDEDEVLEAAERSSPIVLTPSQPFPPRSRTRSGSIAGTALGRRTKSRNTAVRPSLLGAIEFRDVVNSLAENSSANSLAIFGDLDASGSSDGRPPSRISIGHRSLSHVPRAGSQHDGTVRPSHRRAVSATEVPLETPLEFDASVWDKPLGSADKAGRVDLIDLSEGVENPWKSTSASASPLHPRQLLKLDTSMLPQNVVSASPLPVTPRPRPASQNKAVRKVPSIILVNEAGQETPVTLLSPPDTPTGVRIPSWMVSSGRRRRKIKLALRSLKGALFPSLNGFRQKSIVAAFLAIVSTPAVFVLIITLPVVDEEGDDDASEYQEKEIVISHHTLTSQPPPEDEDEEEQEGWQDRARLRNDHIAHVLHSPVAFRRSGPLPDSYSAPVDLDGVDAELVRQQPDAYTEFDVDGNPREYFPSGGLSPPASIKGDLDQDAMDQKVSDALILVQCALSPFFVVMTTLGRLP